MKTNYYKQLYTNKSDKLGEKKKQIIPKSTRYQD